MSIADLRYLSFEVAPTCNLAAAHGFCPVNDPLRYPAWEPKEKCPDAVIVSFASAVHRRGFKGLVGFHYYCDPLVDVKRMLRLMHWIKVVEPAAKFILWSNGLLLKQVHRNWLESFDKVVFTKHVQDLEKRVHDVVTNLPNIQFGDAYYDARFDLYTATGRARATCIRPAKIELPVNYYGSVRLCCADYRGTVSLGNIAFEEHEKVLDSFEEAGRMASDGRIPVCQKCCSLPSSPRAVV